MNPLQIIKAHNDLNAAMSRVDSIGEMSVADANAALDSLIQQAEVMKTYLNGQVPAAREEVPVMTVAAGHVTRDVPVTTTAAGHVTSTGEDPFASLSQAFGDTPAEEAPPAFTRYKGPLPDVGQIVGYLGGHKVKVIQNDAKVKMMSESMLMNVVRGDVQIDEARLQPLDSDEVLISSADMED